MTYLRAFRRARPQVVLAEFGHVGVQALDACRQLDLPLVVHFHGFDAHCRPMLETAGTRYRELFDYSAAIVVVSKPMRQALVSLGAPPEKTHYSPYGVDPDLFRAGAPAEAPPTFIAVGRFVEKKAPHLTITAFASAHRGHRTARLRMIGEGELLGPCRDLAQELGIAEAVDFLGTQPSDRVAREMRGARAFVQHSVVAGDGDSEGMPNAILEAAASSLPVVSTRHAGIPEAVLDGATGFLVEERDVDAMAARMGQLVENPALAARLGAAGRRRIEQHFTLDASIQRLWSIVRAAAGA